MARYNSQTALYNTLMGTPNQGYNAIGRTAGASAANGSGDNFFVKRGKSIENAVGTTLVTPIAFMNDRIENDKTTSMLRDNKTRMNDVAKKYGYNTYHDVWDARDKAEAEGDTATLDFIDKTINPELSAVANENATKATEKAAKYDDYRKNDYISNKINQNNTKFLGSAINTLSTAADVTGVSSTPRANAIQGGVEGVADEMEQNGANIDLTRLFTQGIKVTGGENFDWGRAGQNALIGAATGAVTGALNKGISNSLAKNGGNLFKGGNALTRGLNNLGSKTALGRVGSTLATGAARGAVSGAVGGATGAGLQSALNGVEFGQGVQNALQGAVQGAQQGAVTGGIMAGANMAISKTPGVGKFYNELQGAKSKWDQSGRNFDERLTNTLTSGDSAFGDWLMNKRQSKVLGAVGNIGNRVQFVDDEFELESIPGMSKNLQKYLKNTPRTLENMAEEVDNAKYLVDQYDKSSDKSKTLLGGIELEGPDGAKMVEAMRELAANGDTIMAEIGGNTQQTPTTANKYVGVDTLGNRTEYTPAQLTKLISDYDNYKQSTTLSGNSFDEVSDVVGPAGSELMNIYKTMNGGVPVDPYSRESWGEFENWLNTQRSNTPTTAKGWAKKAGQRIVEDINNSNLGNRVKDVSSDMPEDIRNMQIRDYNVNPDGEIDTTYGIASDPRVRQQLLANVNAQLAENPNARIGDTNFDADAIISEYSDRLTPEQYRNFNPTDAENALVQELQSLEASQGFTRPNSRQITQTTQVDPWDRVAQEAGYSNYDEVLRRYAEANPNTKVNPRGMAGEVLTWMDQNPNTPTTAKEWAKLAGQRAVEDLNNSNLGLRIKDVSQDAIQEADLGAENPQTRLYRMLAGKQPSPTEIISDSDYGESALANKTKRGMVADALERTGNFLEGAQSNATRAQLKDLGIESAGKVIENVRKKTGITNLETQAAFAKELTGGGDSLMDGVQRVALTESSDGKPFTVDTSDISAQVESVVDKYADTNTFGSQSKRNQFISNLRRDISNYDTDVLSIANRMKSNAADLRGRGVADPKPADAAKARIYTDIANKLEDLSYKAIPQDNIDTMFDTAISEMRNRANVAKANGNDKIATAYIKAAEGLDNEPRTVKAFRSYKKDFVDVSKINELSARAENGAAAQMGRSFGTGVKRLTGTLLQRPVNAVLARAGGAINSVADRIDSNGNTPSTTTAPTIEPTASTPNYTTPTQLYNALSRTQALQNATETRNGANTDELDATAGYIAPLAASTNTPSTSIYNSLSVVPSVQNQVVATAPNSYFQPTGDYWTDMLGQATSKAIDADDVQAFAALYEMYQNSLANQKGNNQASDLNATQQANIAKLNAADSAIDELESLFDQAGGGKGPIVGNLQSIAGDWGWDSGARTYNDLSEGLVNQIAAAIGKTDSLNTEGEVKRALKLIPQLTDDATTARNKLEELRRMLATTKASYNAAYGIAQ